MIIRILITTCALRQARKTSAHCDIVIDNHHGRVRCDESVTASRGSGVVEACSFECGDEAGEGADCGSREKVPLHHHSGVEAL